MPSIGLERIAGLKGTSLAQVLGSWFWLIVKNSLHARPGDSFVDGRGYTLARLLRERHGYRGELRAIGDVLRDQLYYLSRCGFDAFAMRADQVPQQALSAFDEFSEAYQASVERPEPLFRRRLKLDTLREVP